MNAAEILLAQYRIAMEGRNGAQVGSGAWAHWVFKTLDIERDLQKIIDENLPTDKKASTTSDESDT